MIARSLIGRLVAAGILFPAAPASAHAQFLESEPAPGARVDAAPDALTISFSEPPVSARDFTVEDGCGIDVVTSADVEDKDIVAELTSGQPGKWRVSTRVVSAVDGHPTEKSFSFSVTGTADCSAADGGPSPREDSGGSSSVPILLGLAATTVLLVAGALVLRKRS